jgi:hypothetical protein
MTADVPGFVACDCAADRVPLPGGLVHDTEAANRTPPHRRLGDREGLCIEQHRAS